MVTKQESFEINLAMMPVNYRMRLAIAIFLSVFSNKELVVQFTKFKVPNGTQPASR